MLHFAILGTGNIARQFAQGVLGSAHCRLTAVASRSIESAASFARDYAIPTPLAGYESVLARQDVDAVYISLPNHLHHEWTIKALKAGKHVLCEKPIAASAAQAREMFAVARQTGRTLVEAFMYRAHPQTQAVMEVIRSGAIGNVKLIRTCFCFLAKRTEGNIRFNPAFAGGALMDIGCYCINFSNLVAGQAPVKVFAAGHLHPSGIDDYAAGTLAYDNGMAASFACGMTLHSDNSAYICGDAGYIEIPWPWKPPSADAEFFVCQNIPAKQDTLGKVATNSAPRQRRTVSAGRELYAVEADAFAGMILDQAPSFMPERETIACMETLDEMRRQLNVSTHA